jgi:hypothetical protein
MKLTYRDTFTLKLAGEINDFVSDKTLHIPDQDYRGTAATVALSLARESLSLFEWPPEDSATPPQSVQE